MFHGGSEWLNGEPPETIKDFSVNLNPLGTPSFIEDLLFDAIKKKVYRYYPDDYKYLKEKIAEIYNTNPEYIGVYNGSIEALKLLPKIFNVPEPNFSEYPRKSSYLCEEFENSFHCKLKGENVITGNPINPTGFCFPLEEIENFLQNNKFLVLDEAFVDISKCESAIKLIEDYDNLLIISTFTKSLAIPGLRIGFSIGKSSREIESKTIPWRINSISYYVFSHIDAKEVRRFLTISKSEVSRLINDIESIKYNFFKIYRTTAPFILLEFPVEASLVNNELKRYNYKIREPNGFIGLRKTHARVSLNYGTKELFGILEEVLIKLNNRK
ncbi:MAG: aminotransferase class I/II-fold pyridoxal phosphate-dependent enzyme [Sulfolobaceae archaeon]